MSRKPGNDQSCEQWKNPSEHDRKYFNKLVLRYDRLLKSPDKPTIQRCLSEAVEAANGVAADLQIATVPKAAITGNSGMLQWIAEGAKLAAEQAREVAVVAVAWWRASEKTPLYVRIRGGAAYQGQVYRTVWITRSKWCDHRPIRIFDVDHPWARVLCERAAICSRHYEARQRKRQEAERQRQADEKAARNAAPLPPYTDDLEIPSFEGLHWSDVFSRSRHIERAFYICGGSVGKGQQAVSYDLAILALSRRLASTRYEVSSYNPMSGVSDTQRSLKFLDGGYMSEEGNYFGYRRGQWIVGTKALRLVCHALGCTPPKRCLKEEVSIPSDDDLQATLTQLLTGDAS